MHISYRSSTGLYSVGFITNAGDGVTAQLWALLVNAGESRHSELTFPMPLIVASQCKIRANNNAGQCYVSITGWEE